MHRAKTNSILGMLGPRALLACIPYLRLPGGRSVPSEASRTVHRACSLCEACCGLTVQVRDNVVVDVRGDPHDPFSKGYICPKALANVDLLTDPDRLRTPRVRSVCEDGPWREASWDDALDAAATGLAEVVARHGSDAVAVYFGNASAHGSGAAMMGSELLGVLGSRRRYTASSLDQQPQQLVNQLLFGSPVVFAVPDVDRTDHLLILGGNPAVSNGSIMTAPDMRRRIRDIRARGGTVTVVDPRRTETSRLADEHVFIRPGTDALLLLAMIHTLFAEGLVSPGHGGRFLTQASVESLRTVSASFPPGRVEPMTGIPADRIVELTRCFASAPSAVAYGRLGVCQTEFGTTAFWLLTCLNVLTGNLDRTGGLMFPTPAVDLASLLARYTRMAGYDRYRSRIGGIPEVAGDLPTATLAAEILTPGRGQIRALITIGGNPVISAPDGTRMDAALKDLEFMVSVDPFITESGRHADVVLPPRTAFERDDVDVVFGSVSVRNMARFSARVVDPDPDTREDAVILAGLVRRLARRLGSPQARARALGISEIVLRGQMDRLFDLALRSGPYGRFGTGLDLGRVRRAEHGLDLGPLRPSLPGRLFTPKRRIRLDHPVLVADIERVRGRWFPEGSGQASATPVAHAAGDGVPGFDLTLIGRRHVRSNNSWLANSPRLNRGKDLCTVLMHPADASARGIGVGDRVRVTGPSGAIELPAEVSEEIMPGVVAVPHGWGHGRSGVGWTIAAGRPGASVNDITDATVMDPLSGNAVLQAVPVRVDLEPAAQPDAGSVPAAMPAGLT